MGNCYACKAMVKQMDYEAEIMTTLLSYTSGEIEYDEMDERIEEIFSKAVYEELKEKGVEVK